MKRIMLVEGKDDEHVVKNLCGSHQLTHLDEIKEHGGYSTLLESFPVRMLESDVSALGLVIDADTNIAGRWQSIRADIVTAGYQNIPEAPVDIGLVLDAPKDLVLPRLGVWIMPNNQLPGILEDFIALLVPVGNRLFEYSKQCVETIPQEALLFRPVDAPKANIHTWLAWQAEPGKPLGVSITQRVLDANSPAALTFVRWLERLYFS